MTIRNKWGIGEKCVGGVRAETWAESGGIACPFLLNGDPLNWIGWVYLTQSLGTSLSPRSTRDFSGIAAQSLEDAPAGWFR
jgi:hypothetical protein